MLGEDGQQSNTIVVSKPEAKRYNKISQYFPYSKFAWFKCNKQKSGLMQIKKTKTEFEIFFKQNK